MLQLASPNDTAALKDFARTMIWAFPTVFCLLLPWIFGYGIPWWPLVISAVLLALYFLRPRWIYYPYRLWMGIALVLGWINTRIILTTVFFLLILPFGLVLRSLKKLQYKNRPHPQHASYYHRRDDKPEPQRLELPF